MGNDEPDNRGMSGEPLSPEEEDKAFSEGFAEATGEKLPEKKEDSEDPDDAKDDSVDPGKDPGKGDTKAPEGGKAAEPDVTAELEKERQKYSTLQGMHKHDTETYKQEKAQWEADKKKMADELAALKAAQKEKKETEGEADPELKAELESYEKEFDIVAKMEGKRRELALKALKKEVLETITRVKEETAAQLAELKTNIDEKVVPVVTGMQADADAEMHFNAIRYGYKKEDGTVVAGHPDFEKYVDKEDGGNGQLAAWIGTKPAYLQPRLREVYEKGSAADIIELISDFKRESKIKPSAVDDSKVISIRKYAKRQALLGVPDHPASVDTSGPAPKDDFDRGWDDATKGGS